MADHQIQLSSWANLSAFHQGVNLLFPEGWLISQIYFPLNGSAFDSGDVECLAFIHRHYQILLLTNPVVFNFAGYADHRGSEAYNHRLARARAAAVRSYLDGRMGQMNGYTSHDVLSRGKRHATLTRDEIVMAGDRRVDIFSSRRIFNEPTVGEINVKARYTGPLSRKFTFRTLKGWSFPPGAKPGLAVTYLLIEIVNVRSKRKITLKYKGFGISIGVGFNRPTKPEERELPVWLDVDDFVGPGAVRGFGAGNSSTTLIFDGPRIRGKSDGEIKLIFTGWDFVLGVGADFIGGWTEEKTPAHAHAA